MIALRSVLGAAVTLTMEALLATAAVASTQVGVTGAVNPDTFGIPPASVQRALAVGDDVVFQERIRTEASGRAEILFLDRSSLSVGPDADVVIDDFVYSPKDGSGTLAISAAKGLLRYIGGALSKNEDSVTITTPTAVIGIRGGIAVVEIGADGATRALFLYGREMTMRTLGGDMVRITRPGFFSSVGRSDSRPADPARASPAQLRLTFANNAGKPSATTSKIAAAVATMPAVSTVAQLKAATVTKPVTPGITKVTATTITAVAPKPKKTTVTKK